MAQRTGNNGKTTGNNTANQGIQGTQATTGNDAANQRNLAEIARINLERENQRKLAYARNATPVYAFLYNDKRHCELWGLSQIQETTMTFIRKNESGESIKTRESVYVGKLSTALMTLNHNAKGETQRGAIRPIAFWYIKATQEIGCFNGATQEERDTVTLYVTGLMKKYLTGVAMIEKGDFKSVKGFDSRKAVLDANGKKNAMGIFMSAYLNKKDATQDEINLAAKETAKATQAVTPVNMD